MGRVHYIDPARRSGFLRDDQLLVSSSSSDDALVPVRGVTPRAGIFLLAARGVVLACLLPGVLFGLGVLRLFMLAGRVVDGGGR